MYDMYYIDESIVEKCRKQFKQIYPEFLPKFLGASNDRKALIVECSFPDGIFYFRVTEDSVSHSYNTKEQADEG